MISAGHPSTPALADSAGYPTREFHISDQTSGIDMPLYLPPTIRRKSTFGLVSQWLKTSKADITLPQAKGRFWPESDRCRRPPPTYSNSNFAPPCQGRRLLFPDSGSYSPIWHTQAEGGQREDFSFADISTWVWCDAASAFHNFLDYRQ